MSEPHDETAAPGREVTLTDDEIETRSLGDAVPARPTSQDDTGDTGDDSGDVSDTGDDSGDTGDDSGA